MSKEDLQEPEQDQDAPENDGPPEDALEVARRERAEYLINWQRARADFQNLKRRTLEDIEAAVARERAALLEENLTVLDYLDMALSAPCESQEAQNLQVGVRMTRDQLWALLERQQVRAIPAEGAFDPEVHQAVATLESSEVDPGQIVEVVRSGYKIGDRVLRYAQVKVSASPESDIEQPEQPDAEAGLEDS
jgi:molecular chaperone GrpE